MSNLVPLQSSLNTFESLGGHALSPEEIAIVKKHALFAMGASFIPVPGVYWPAVYANDIYMFKEINGLHHISFDRNQMKTIVFAMVTEMGMWWVAKKGFFEMVKLLPGLGALAGGALRAAQEAAEVFVVAVVYSFLLRESQAEGGSLSDERIKALVAECMTTQKDSLKKIYDNALRFFKKTPKSEIEAARVELEAEMEGDEEKDYLDVVQAVNDYKNGKKATIKQTSAYSVIFCPDCGAEMQTNAKFCEECGKPLGFMIDNKKEEESP